jgi:hypothetical protein
MPVPKMSVPARCTLRSPFAVVCFSRQPTSRPMFLLETFLDRAQEFFGAAASRRTRENPPIPSVRSLSAASEEFGRAKRPFKSKNVVEPP